jgi:hypothetical protein
MDLRSSEVESNFGSFVAYAPELIPPIALMREEGIDVFEEWFRWGNEWGLY